MPTGCSSLPVWLPCCFNPALPEELDVSLPHKLPCTVQSSDQNKQVHENKQSPGAWTSGICMQGSLGSAGHCACTTVHLAVISYILVEIAMRRG